MSQQPRQDRYARQSVLPFIGERGQKKIARTHVAVIGCGALGSVSATLLCRGGIGALTLIDRDIVEETNLQRQILFNQADIGMSKAQASAQALRKIRDDIRLTVFEEHLDHRNAASLLNNADIIVDGSDNFLVRMITNDFAVKHHKPWVYGGVLAGEGVFWPILAGGRPCLRCQVSELPPVGASPGCDVAGIIGSASVIIASHQVTAVLRIITGQEEGGTLTSMNIWENRHQRVDMPPDPNCPCCSRSQFQFLDGDSYRQVLPLCSRAVQLLPEKGIRLSLPIIRQRLETLTEIVGDEQVLRFQLDGEEVTLFADGRAIFKGSGDEKRCHSLYSRYIGE